MYYHVIQLVEACGYPARTGAFKLARSGIAAADAAGVDAALLCAFDILPSVADHEYPAPVFNAKLFYRVFDHFSLCLLYTSIISGILGDIESAIVIFVVITINAVLGTVQHIKAEQSLDSLKEMSAPEAKVIREGDIKVVSGKDVTVGDIVIVEAGDFVCADGRIIENASLKADESALTGESEPVEKQDVVLEGDKPLGDRVNMPVSYTHLDVYKRQRLYFRMSGFRSGSHTCFA